MGQRRGTDIGVDDRNAQGVGWFRWRNSAKRNRYPIRDSAGLSNRKDSRVTSFTEQGHAAISQPLRLVIAGAVAAEAPPEAAD
jgi:hypothetical protein